MTDAALDQRNAIAVLLRLSEGNRLKTALQDIVKNLYTLDRLLAALKEEGYVSVDQKPFGKNIQEISLTEKGKRVSGILKRARSVGSKDEPMIVDVETKMVESIQRYLEEHPEEGFRGIEEFVIAAVREKIKRDRRRNSPKTPSE